MGLEKDYIGELTKDVPGGVREVVRSYLILSLRSMNDLPLMERWLLKDHCVETLALHDPILDRYVSYRAVPPPEGAEAYGYYNWRMTEHWWRESPFPTGDQMEVYTSLAERWPPEYEDIVGLPKGEFRSSKWLGKPEGPHPPVFAFVPRRPTEDFKGRGLTLDDGTNLRWIIAIKYPEGVPVDEGEDWYLNVHAKEVMAQPGLKRFFSFRVLEQPKVGPWIRISEQWYENANAWHRAVIEEPPLYTKPPWARYDRYPFLEPYVDFVSTFILECPTNDFKRYCMPYIFTA
ncbi:MAG: hypothetical protein ACPL5F_01895 [Moorellaceae bacterium]